MGNLQVLLATVFLLCCNLAKAQKKPALSSEPKKPEISFLKEKSASGQITFSQQDKTVFYYIPAQNTGKIKLGNTEYELNEYFIDSKTKTYTILGKHAKTSEPISISVPECHFRKPNGEDCFYGSCFEASVSIPDYTILLRDLIIQDCSSN